MALWYGIPPQDARRFGWSGGGHARGRLDHILSNERGWNVAASSDPAAALAAARLLADKIETARRLEAAAIAVVPSLPLGLLEPDAVEAVLDRLLDRWSEVFLKPRQGSRGVGAATLRRTSGGVEVVPYGRGDAVADPMAYLRTMLGDEEYVAQPLLRGDDRFTGVADARDIVTLRLITRDLGQGPQFFCALMAVPVPGSDPLGYESLVVAPDGSVLGPAPRRAERGEQAAPGDARMAIGDALTGHSVAAMAGIVADAQRAHRTIGGIYAVGWDVALTSQGPFFLEGNAGFGTGTCQEVAGGLLAGRAAVPVRRAEGSSESCR